MTDNNLSAGTAGYAAPAGKKTKSIVALVLGIVSIVTSLFWFLSIPAGVAALVLGFLGRRSEPSGRTMALAGIITGILGIIVAIVFIIVANALAVAYLNGDITIPTN